MRNFNHSVVCLCILAFLLIANLDAQSQNRVTKGKPIPRNPKWTVIIDYVDTFTGHRPKHKPRTEPPPPEEGCPEGDPHCPDQHFELIGGVWGDSTAGVVDPALGFVVDLRGFPQGSDQAIANAFATWEAATTGWLVGGIVFEDAVVSFADGVNTYSMRNLGGGGVLAATFMTWDDLDDNSEINGGEPFLEMDVIHNSTVQWGLSESRPKGRWWDVQNVATHEVGHVFGLDHPGDAHDEDKRQTMFASSPPKETSKRSLEVDGDIPGIQSEFLGYQ